MKRGLATLITLAFALQAQTQPHLPRGTATDVTNAEIQTALKKTAASKVSDQQLSVVSINGEYNVAIGVLHRAKTSGKDAGGGLEHSLVTEVYQIISGNGTFVTGGTLLDPKESAPDSTIVKVLDGPSTSGGPIQKGLSRKVGPGDMIIIPPNTAHWFREITTDQIDYTVVRIDTHKVLPAPYPPK
jgi:mannose-6-phosphate isomerase-like protein (cupin superfamily)